MEETFAQSVLQCFDFMFNFKFYYILLQLLKETSTGKNFGLQIGSTSLVISFSQ